MVERNDGAATQGSARGEAAWKDAREATSRRNADAYKRGRVERQTREEAAKDRDRAEAVREAAQLQALNKRISKSGR